MNKELKLMANAITLLDYDQLDNVSKVLNLVYDKHFCMRSAIPLELLDTLDKLTDNGVLIQTGTSQGFPYRIFTTKLGDECFNHANAMRDYRKVIVYQATSHFKSPMAEVVLNLFNGQKYTYGPNLNDFVSGSIFSTLLRNNAVFIDDQKVYLTEEMKYVLTQALKAEEKGPKAVVLAAVEIPDADIIESVYAPYSRDVRPPTILSIDEVIAINPILMQRGLIDGKEAVVPTTIGLALYQRTGSQMMTAVEMIECCYKQQFDTPALQLLRHLYQRRGLVLITSINESVLDELKRTRVVDIVDRRVQITPEAAAYFDQIIMKDHADALSKVVNNYKGVSENKEELETDHSSDYHVVINGQKMTFEQFRQLEKQMKELNQFVFSNTEMSVENFTMKFHGIEINQTTYQRIGL